MIDDEREISYACLWREIDDESARLRSLLRCSGHEAVGIDLSDRIAWVVWVLAVMRSGGVAILLQDGWSEARAPSAQVSITYLITDSAVICEDKRFHFYDRLTDGVTMWRVMPSADECSFGRVYEPSVVIFTSGTSGTAKAVLHSSASLLSSAERFRQLQREFFSPLAIAKMATVFMRNPGAFIRAAFRRRVWLTDLSPTSVSGLTLLVQVLYSGDTIVLSRKHTARGLLEQLARYRACVFATVPAVLRMLVKSSALGEYDLSALLVVGVGGGPVSPELVEVAARSLRCEVAIGYGSTELGGGVLVTRLFDSRESRERSVGRPFPGVDVTIRDESGLECADGVIGELWCKSPGMMVNYVDGHSPVGTPSDMAGWWKTNDLAVRCPDGSLRVLGRSDDVLIRGGRKIAPNWVESIIESISGVSEVVVGGTREATGEDLMHAWVVPSPRVSIDPVKLRASVAAVGPLWAVPHRIHIVQTLPKTNDGKVKRRALIASLRDKKPSAQLESDTPKSSRLG